MLRFKTGILDLLNSLLLTLCPLPLGRLRSLFLIINVLLMVANLSKLELFICPIWFLSIAVLSSVFVGTFFTCVGLNIFFNFIIPVTNLHLVVFVLYSRFEFIVASFTYGSSLANDKIEINASII